MAFTLIIDIRGLCLLAPAPDPDNPDVQHMHVLLPDDTGGHHATPHFGSFRFHRKYNADTSSTRTHVPFENLRCDLSRILNRGVSTSLPAEVGDVERFVQPRRPLPRPQTRRNQQVNVKAHLVLGAGGVRCLGRVPHFDVGDHRDVRMASMLQWVIEDFPGEELAWQLETLPGVLLANQPDSLVPRDGILRMELLHAPDEVAEDECNHSLPNHFPMYYTLFPGNGDTPRCTGELDKAGCVEDEATSGTPAPGNKAPNVFTCMIGRTTVG